MSSSQNASSTNERVRIFAARDEVLNLYWPLVVLLIFISVSPFNFQKSTNITNFVFAISNIVFLNVVHNVFSIFILTEIPEIKSYIKENLKNKKIHIGYSSALVLAFFLVLNWVFPIFKNYGEFGKYLFWAAVLFMQFFALYYHTLRQIEGISTIYNQQMKKIWPQNITHFDFVQKCEKILFKLLIVLSCIGYALNIFEQKSHIFAVFLMSLFVFLGVIAVNLKIPFWNKSNKWIYLLRLVVFPLGIYYPLLGVVIPFFHGVEYLFIVKKIFSSSALTTEKIQRRLFVYMLPISLAVAVLSIFRLDRGFGVSFLSDNNLVNTLIVFASSLSLAISFLHFYLDSFIYKMKESGIRNSIGKLLS